MHGIESLSIPCNMFHVAPCMVALIYTCTCTSQGSGRPIEPGKKRPAANN